MDQILRLSSGSALEGKSIRKITMLSSCMLLRELSIFTGRGASVCGGGARIFWGGQRGDHFLSVGQRGGGAKIVEGQRGGGQIFFSFFNLIGTK